MKTCECIEMASFCKNPVFSEQMGSDHNDCTFIFENSEPHFATADVHLC